MKKILCAVLATTLVAGLAGCSSNSEAGGQSQPPAVGETYSIEVGSTNPLSQKQYKALEIDGKNDFLEFFNLLNGEYSGLIIEFSNYMETHTSDIEIDNKGFADFDDYESTFDHYYQFLYGVLHCDSKSIPNEYNDAWSCYKTTIAQNKEDLDGLYLLRGQELIDGADEMLTHIQVGMELVAEALPDNDSYSDLEIVAAEFCMAYMNHLKNPYSFTIKSIWAYDSPTGGYHVYVKFTAQNSFGADEVKEITNNVPITDSVLESISRTDEVLSSLTIYVSEGQNERNDGSHGEWLDTDRIQSYIDDNYV